ncbi:hypothetical protein B0I33_11563 [Prauserella shujinwangii]|uniref:Secreted protein n=1 Tax=Prauserella shujinwangii TaxID=1453103 RepID=A0A2T0LKM0_9PSEU|nr:hypothetical protein [Prauserella shujinwangii]PRX43445.1 hypothetical protein B0I33_11563 [Prauserella shujinwangii]
MPTWLVVVIVVAAVVVAGLAAWLAVRERRRRRLRERFGAEYDRAVEEHGSARAAEQDLEERERRHSELDIRPLSPSARERFTHEWNLVQERFVDRPAQAVAEADRLLDELMAERGYPTGDHDQQVADLSVRHARTIEHYRAARGTLSAHERTEASTERLREAMVRYRTVFDDLLTDGAGTGGTGGAGGDGRHTGDRGPAREGR